MLTGQMFSSDPISGLPHAMGELEKVPDSHQNLRSSSRNIGFNERSDGRQNWKERQGQMV